MGVMPAFAAYADIEADVLPVDAQTTACAPSWQATEIATAFAEEDVSIQSLRQAGRGADAQLVVVSHDATDAQLAATVERLRGLACVREVTSVMRVEGMAE